LRTELPGRRVRPGTLSRCHRTVPSAFTTATSLKKSFGGKARALCPLNAHPGQSAGASRITETYVVRWADSWNVPATPAGFSAWSIAESQGCECNEHKERQTPQFDFSPMSLTFALHHFSAIDPRGHRSIASLSLGNCQQEERYVQSSRSRQFKRGKGNATRLDIVIASLIFTINALTLGHLATPNR
jgi:hypothetical protein